MGDLQTTSGGEKAWCLEEVDTHVHWQCILATQPMALWDISQELNCLESEDTITQNKKKTLKRRRIL